MRSWELLLVLALAFCQCQAQDEDAGAADEGGDAAEEEECEEAWAYVEFLKEGMK